MEVAPYMGALSAAGWAWSSARGWLGVVVAQKGDLNWKL